MIIVLIMSCVIQIILNLAAIFAIKLVIKNLIVPNAPNQNQIALVAERIPADRADGATCAKIALTSPNNAGAQNHMAAREAARLQSLTWIKKKIIHLLSSWTMEITRLRKMAIPSMSASS